MRNKGAAVPSSLRWRVHTAGLLDEIIRGSGQGIYRIPLTLLKLLLAEVGERAAELNDPKLNALMCRLAIYSISDPYDAAYDQKRVNEILLEAEKVHHGR